MAEDGHVYERDAIERWLSSNARSPLTNAPIGTRLTDCGSTRALIESAIENGVVVDESAAAWHVESAKAKAEGKLPGVLSSVKDHLLLAAALDSSSPSASAEISLMLRAVELGLQVDALANEGTEAGTDGVASVLDMVQAQRSGLRTAGPQRSTNPSDLAVIKRENAQLRLELERLQRSLNRHAAARGEFLLGAVPSPPILFPDGPNTSGDASTPAAPAPPVIEAPVDGIDIDNAFLDYEPITPATSRGMTADQARVFRFYTTEGTGDEGCNVNSVASSLAMDLNQVKHIVEFLSSEGHLYSTIDDDHHKSTFRP